MSLKRLYIFFLGLVAIGSIATLYFVLGDVFFQNKGLVQWQKQEIQGTSTGSTLSSETSCIAHPKEVKIYTYMFHYVIPDKYVNPDNKIEYGNSISPEKLENILVSLSGSRDAGKIAIASLSELATFKKTDCFPNKNIVLLTVDDGWDDGYNFLFPLARKYAVKFNLAIIAGKVSTTASEINNFLNEREIQEMLDSHLITLASHSFSHIELHAQTEASLKKELSESKNTLEKWFHIDINTIVYPSGKYDLLTLKKAEEYGYSFGFTTTRWVTDYATLQAHPLTLPRIRVNRDTDIAKAFSFE